MSDWEENANLLKAQRKHDCQEAGKIWISAGSGMCTTTAELAALKEGNSQNLDPSRVSNDYFEENPVETWSKKKCDLFSSIGNYSWNTGLNQCVYQFAEQKKQCNAQAGKRWDQVLHKCEDDPSNVDDAPKTGFESKKKEEKDDTSLVIGAVAGLAVICGLGVFVWFTRT